jgi:hypothetical protein
MQNRIENPALAVAAINAWNRLDVATRQISGEWVTQWITPAHTAGRAA